MCMLEDGKDRFWVGTYRNGLYLLDTRTRKEEHMASTEGQRICSIARDRDGNLYTASFNDGLRSYTPDGKKERLLSGGRLALLYHYFYKLHNDLH